MSNHPQVRLAAFITALVVVFGAAWFVGRAIGPDPEVVPAAHVGHELDGQP